MKYRVRKKRMNQKAGHNSYSKTRQLFKRLRMRQTHPWMMASDLKYHIRLANFPVTTNDTLWTSYLRLKRIHHRQMEYRVVRDVNIVKCCKSLMESIEKTNELKLLARQFNIPVVTGHQLNRVAAQDVMDVFKGGKNEKD